MVEAKIRFCELDERLFQANVPDEYIMAVAQVMKLANWHTYQVLTKRSERMRDMLNGKLREHAVQKHIWWGVSVEDRQFCLARIDHLRAARAAVRFLSIEPLLEDLGHFALDGIDWVIVGGESGIGARPMKKDWVQAIRRLCVQDKVPFFFKQWGGVHKTRAGRLLGGLTYDEMPPRHTGPMPAREHRHRIAEALAPIAQVWQAEEQLRRLFGLAAQQVCRRQLTAG